MTRTPTQAALTATTATTGSCGNAKTDAVLRDLAFVLQLSKTMAAEIRAQASGGESVTNRIASLAHA